MASNIYENSGELMVQIPLLLLIIYIVYRKRVAKRINLLSDKIDVLTEEIDTLKEKGKS
jgi:hypothetical protein